MANEVRFYCNGKYLPDKPRKRTGTSVASSKSHKSSNWDEESSVVSGSSTGSRGMWTPVDSRRAAVNFRKRDDVHESTLRDKEEEGEKERERKRVLEQIEARMSERAWRELPLANVPDEQPSVISNREGKPILNPQARSDTVFQPLQYCLGGCFDELLRSGKKGANFQPGSPRIDFDRVVRAKRREERLKAANRLRAGLDRVVSEKRSQSAPPPRRQSGEVLSSKLATFQFGETGSTESAARHAPRYFPVEPVIPPTLAIATSLNGKLGPTFGKAARCTFAMTDQYRVGPRYGLESDPRNVSYCVYNPRFCEKSAWARSTSPKIGLPKHQCPV
ncbi:hypothetical protein DIPPA_20989 [Diplonema papillatum]|nr:hypothetical protein DIPPA_27800 [Diplonema papillatum]KAJ9444384.1 hypothetical protein DIPPA_20989 [Diplonema papillatum]